MRSGFLALCLILASLAPTSIQGQVPPFVVAHPASVSAYPGDPVTLSASIDGTAPISYQWSKNGPLSPGRPTPACR